MRVLALIVALALGTLWGVGSAAAEKVKTNQSTKLFSRPGEQSKVLLSVKSGQSMTLLSKDGRWLKVRVQGRTGYVPRSKVDMGDDDFARNTRSRPFVQGRGKKRGFGGEGAPDDRVGADAMGDNDSGDSGGGDEDEEEDEPKPKKAAVKVKAAAKDEDEEDDEDEAPKSKKSVAKSVTKAKPGAKDEGDDDEDEEDEEKPAAKPAAKKPAAKDEDEDEDDEADTKPAAKKAKPDEDEDADDKKTDDESDEEKRPQARVTKKVAVRDDPEEDSEERFVVRPTDTLYPTETKGSWTFVENAEGDGGWVQSDLLESGGAGGGGKRAIDVRARTGILIIQQAMRTSGSNVNNVPDNYNTATSAITLALGAGIVVPRGKKMLLGGEFTYDMSKTLLGGVFFDPDGKMGTAPGVNIGITVHNVNVRGMIGVDFHKKSGMALFGRLGYRYQGFLITDVASMTANPAQLPSEVVKGPTIGGSLAIPMLTDKIGLRFSLDALVFGGSVTQTKGLEDGASPSVKAIVVGAALNYRLGKSFDLQATYDLNYMGIDFGAPLAASTRVHMGTNVERADIFHGVTFGISKPF